MGTYAGLIRQSSSAMDWIKLMFVGVLLSIFIQVAVCEGEPTESECRPYIEKALKEQHLEEIAIGKTNSADFLNEQGGSLPTDKLDDSTHGSEPSVEQNSGSEEITDNSDDAKNVSDEISDEKTEEQEVEIDEDEKTDSNMKDDQQEENAEDEESSEKGGIEEESVENTDTKDDGDRNNNNNISDDDDDEGDDDDDTKEKMNDSEEDETDKGRDDNETNEDTDEVETKEADDNESSKKDEEEEEEKENESLERPIEIDVQEIEIDEDGNEEDNDQKESEESHEEDINEQKENEEDKTEEDEKNEEVEVEKTEEEAESLTEKVEKEIQVKKVEESAREADRHEDETSGETEKDDEESNLTKEIDDKTESDLKSEEQSSELLEKIETMKPEAMPSTESGESEAEKDEPEGIPEEEELTQEMVIPDNLRPRDHINQILKLDEDSTLEKILEKTIDSTLKSLKGLYDNAIKPLEVLYKYKDLSNRHFGDPEIFSKPLILFMGPWSGGKSSTINYLLNNEFSHTSLRTGAEPSPAYFNILMYGDKEEILDGTQLAADWTFSGLQKFGQGLLDRLKGVKLPNKLLEKVNIVEIPGILEIRKQVQRLFPFNDACQWFIDRADIIFLVYDPSKLDVGPETEAILDQLKGREYQTRIILNKADQVKPEELMRVQGTLIWNISPLMSSSEPPVMYSTSLWSMPYEVGAPTRLLLAQERAFLRDLREAIDKRVENKISSARRFAVRVRNHAKMVDCYLTTYYNHKSFFGNRKKISDDIIENPQKYHIYEGLSTLTNISRYDLPDPDVYRDFFKINPLYDFQKLSDTCTYFRGCPINKLDVVIAYDLPELVGKYRKAVEAAKEQLQKENS